MNNPGLNVQGQNLWILTAFTGFDPGLGNDPLMLVQDLKVLFKI